METTDIPYLDHIFYYGETFKDHLSSLNLLKQFGVKLKAEKCVFFKTEIKYLGKITSEKDYKDDPINTEATEKLREFPETMGRLT